MSPTLLTALLTVVSTIGAAGLAATLIRERVVQHDILGERLEKALPFTLEEKELAMPFVERVVRPVLERLGKRLTPKKRRDDGGPSQVDRMLDAAGRPYGLTAGAFTAMSLIAAVAFAIVGYLLAALLNQTGTMLLAGPLMGGLLGIVGPRVWVQRKGKKRVAEIRYCLPGACDLLTVSVEAGLSLDGAMQRVAEKYDNALGQQFAMTLHSIQLGTPRVEAFTEMSRRCDVDDLDAFVRSIIQSLSLGSGLSRVLRIQSEEMRRRRRERAEQRGQQAPLKMLFPMVGCIFPSIFIVLLGPAVLQVMSR